DGWGIDIAPNMVAAAEGAAATLPPALRAKCRLRVADVEKLPFEDRMFDAVTASGVFEYIDADRPALHEIRRVLRPGGLLIASFRNRAFNVFTANDYTEREVEASRLTPLVREVGDAIAADAPSIAARAAAFHEALAANVSRMSPPAPPAAPAEKRREKTMPRRQQPAQD